MFFVKPSIMEKKFPKNKVNTVFKKQSFQQISFLKIDVVQKLVQFPNVVQLLNKKKSWR